ncbi:MAG TPA: hypothetical protein VHK91_00475 [Flavisolibacter sp.]|jgi:hypothetical protein|nr:hypothetical protein [Flavisolibacter sp.]
MNEKSPHILNASSNLLGFCFVVLTTLKVMKLSHSSRIDELTAVAIFLLMISLLCSFFSIRSAKPSWEKVADLSFVAAIITLFITTMLFTFDIID